MQEAEGQEQTPGQGYVPVGGPGDVPLGMPGPDSSDKEFVEYFLREFSKPFDPNIPLEKQEKDRQFNIYLANELLEKLEDQAAYDKLRAAIDAAKQVH